MAEKRGWKSYLPVFIGVLFLIVVIILSNPLTILEVIVSARIPMLVLAAISVMVTYLVQTVRFRMLFSTFHRPPPLLRTYRIVISAAITNLVFPAGGGDVIIRPYLLKKTDRKSFRKTFLCVLLERIMDLFALLVLVLVALYVILPTIMPYVMVLVLAGAVIVLSLLFFPGKALPFEVPAFIKRNILILRKMRAVPVRKVMLAGLLTLVNILFIVLNVVLVVMALNVWPTVEIVGLFFISAMAGVLSLIPGGLGVTDGSIAGLFFLMGYSPSLGLSIALMNRFVILLVSLVFALGLLPKLKRVER